MLDNIFNGSENMVGDHIPFRKNISTFNAYNITMTEDPLKTNIPKKEQKDRMKLK